MSLANYTRNDIMEWLNSEALELDDAPTELTATDEILDMLGLLDELLRRADPAMFRTSLLAWREKQRRRGRTPITFTHIRALISAGGEK